MPPSFELSDKHCEILEPLTRTIRVLTHQQIARTLFAGIKNKENAIRTLVSELEQAGYLKSYSAMIHPELELQAPLCSYSPGDPTPNFKLVARETRGRWHQAPIATDIVYATQQAKEIFGGYLGGKKPRASETRHDIHVAQIYLKLAKQDPTLSEVWVPEEQLLLEREGKAGRLPDALLRTDSPVIIEFGGAYPRAKLEVFHVEQREQSYELW